jgi:hypothetical protein
MIGLRNGAIDYKQRVRLMTYGILIEQTLFPAEKSVSIVYALSSLLVCMCG